PDLLGISRPGAADSQKIGDIFNSRVQGDNYPDTGGLIIVLKVSLPFWNFFCFRTSRINFFLFS
ncbi:MAG: hypothetical protein PVI90_06670, partial [Desulfobacteraceae bacterium]